MAIPIFYTSGGKHHVSLSIPGKQSQICKSIGITASVNFLIPTVEYITQCAFKGDLGIADSIKKNKSIQYLNKSSSPAALKTLLKSLQLTLDGDPSKYLKNGKFNIPYSAVSLTNPNEDVGLKMIEKVAVKSILDQYKPWIEVAKIVVQNLSQIEDIIARAAALTLPSEKPVGNTGDTSRPKSLGYGGSADMNKALGQITSIGTKMDEQKAKRGTQSTDGSGSNLSTNQFPVGVTYSIISTVYSTGVFKEGTNYTYQYIDLPPDDIGPIGETFSGLGDSDIYKNLRPRTMIFGIYDSKGNEISPTDNIKSFEIGPNGSVIYGSDISGVQKADWLPRTGRWYGSFPRKGLVYVWRKNGQLKYNASNPSVGNDPNWKQLFYIDKDRNIGEDQTDSSGNANAPVLHFNDNEKAEQASMFEDIVDKKFTNATELTSDEKVQYKQKIMSQVDVQTQLESVSQNGFFSDISANGLLSSNGSPTTLPNGLINAYRPRNIQIGTNSVWIDPETDYDMKLIQIDQSSRIKFKDDIASRSPIVDAQILAFIKNSIELRISTQQPFSVDIIKQATTGWSPYIAFPTNMPGRYENIPQFTLDNWNYKDDIKVNSMRVLLRVTSDIPPLFWQTKPSYTWDADGDKYTLEKTGGKWRIKRYSNDSNKTPKAITFIGDSSEFTSAGITLGSRFKLPDNSYAYFNKNTHELVKWEYLSFDSNSTPIMMPSNNGEKRSWVLNFGLVGGNTIQSPLSSTTTALPPNQIRLKEPNNPFGRLLDPTKITNDQLAESNPLKDRYSSGFYGHSSPTDKQKIERLFRYMKSEYDTETYYIVEGILSDDNNQSSTSTGTGQATVDSGNYYKKPHALGAIKVFISMLTDIFSKLVPAIKKLMELFKSPAGFITGIIMDRLGESSKIFSSSFVNDLAKLEALPLLQRKEFAKSSSLGKYVYVAANGDYRVLFDGAAIKQLNLFGAALSFGIEVKKAIPKLIFSNSVPSSTTNSLQSILNGTSTSNNIGGISNNPNSTTTSTGTSPNPIDPTLADSQSLSVVYSTGKYIDGIKYKYIYVTQYVSGLVKEGDDLVATNDPAQMNLALSKYDEALKSDPNNKLIEDKLTSLMKKIPNYNQPVIEMLLTLVTAPLTLISKVVEKILDFFTNLTLAKLATDIVDFISFKWILDIFDPSIIFGIFGLDTLPIPLPGNPAWIQATALFATYKKGSIPDDPNKPKTIPPGMPTKNGSFNFNDVIGLGFAPFMKRPTIGKTPMPVGSSSLSKEHIQTMFKNSPKIEYKKFNLSGVPPITELISQFICFIESIINSVIDLFWAILGLEALIAPPHIDLCSKFNTMNPQSMADILNGKFTDPLSASASINDSKNNFIYEIKTSDGRDIRELNQVELQQWIDDNKGYTFDFSY